MSEKYIEIVDELIGVVNNHYKIPLVMDNDLVKIKVMIKRYAEIEAENKALRDCLSFLYHNHGHGNYDEACVLWHDILNKFDVKRPDEDCSKRFYGIEG